MRITDRMTLNNSIQHINEKQELLFQLREKLTSSKQFDVASDDPSAASRSLQLRSNMQTLQSYLDTTTLAGDWMKASEASIQQMVDIAHRAITLVTRGINDTLNTEDKAKSIASEMNSLLTEAIDVANSTQSDQYLFSGLRVNTKPFTLNPDETIGFAGDNKSMQRNLGQGKSVTINVQGETAFRGFLEGLVQAKNALLQNNTTVMGDSLSKLQSALETMSQHQSGVGANLNITRQVTDYMEKMKIETSSLLLKKENIDTAECLSTLYMQQTNYQAVLEVSQRAISALSLFDYLH